MTNTVMTFHESYGTLPTGILRLIRRHNVSPADFDMMTDILGNVAYEGNGVINWDVIEAHILDNLVHNNYVPRYF